LGGGGEGALPLLVNSWRIPGGGDLGAKDLKSLRLRSLFQLIVVERDKISESIAIMVRLFIEQLFEQRMSHFCKNVCFPIVEFKSSGEMSICCRAREYFVEEIQMVINKRF
jgi:hypothetical protein